MTYLKAITERKYEEVARAKKLCPVSELAAMETYSRRCLSLVDQIASYSPHAVIAEFKRASPSRGTISQIKSPALVADGYVSAGAQGISVLTDFEGFGGSLEDLALVRSTVAVPLLRKDFIIDSYQLNEAKAFGADVVLLIAAALTREQSSELSAEARSLGLEVLLELHDESELVYIEDNISIVGVNNRNLHTFEVSLEASYQLAEYLPSHLPKISESGISSVAQTERLAAAGFDGYLVGASFMEQTDPGAACKAFISEVRRHEA